MKRFPLEVCWLVIVNGYIDTLKYIKNNTEIFIAL